MNSISTDREINTLLESQKAQGGLITLKTGCYDLSAPLVIDTPSQKLCGEVWAYNLDPNGVFETSFGTKLRLLGKEHPAIRVGDHTPPAGAVICDIGIQGDITGMDTRRLFDPRRPAASAGLYFGSVRVDQGDFSKISCCGLACGVSIAENAEIDGCDFRKINVDGCDLGIYFSPRAAYYPHFVRCIAADNPSYGFLADGTGRETKIHNMDITDTNFIRNCGSNHLNERNCAVYWKHIHNCIFRDNLVDSPGVFWYYKDDAKENTDKQIFRTEAAGLVILGNKNTVMNNVFKNSSAESICIEGNQNVLMCNVADSDVIIEGEGNIVHLLTFTTEKARLILKGKARHTTTVTGVSEDRIRAV